MIMMMTLITIMIMMITYYFYGLVARYNLLTRAWFKKSMPLLVKGSKQLKKWKGTCDTMSGMIFLLVRIPHQSQTDAIIPRMWISGTTCIRQLHNRCYPRLTRKILRRKLRGWNKRILRISFSLDLTPYPLWKLCLATPLTQIALLKLISLKTSYFCIKQLGRGIWWADMKWNHASGCYIQDHEIWVSIVLPCC